MKNIERQPEYNLDFEKFQKELRTILEIKKGKNEDLNTVDLKDLDSRDAKNWELFKSFLKETIDLPIDSEAGVDNVEEELKEKVFDLIERVGKFNKNLGGDNESQRSFSSFIRNISVAITANLSLWFADGEDNTFGDCLKEIKKVAIALNLDLENI